MKNKANDSFFYVVFYSILSIGIFTINLAHSHLTDLVNQKSGMFQNKCIHSLNTSEHKIINDLRIVWLFVLLNQMVYLHEKFSS